jgi:formate/nitrite transporter FocA (FNT family)
MAYLAPAEFAKKVVDAGESKLHMATRDVLIRAFMAGRFWHWQQYLPLP